MRKVFLSYSRADSLEFARELHRRFVRDGIKCFFDEASIEWGQNFVLALENGLDESDHIIVVLSPGFVASEWTTVEHTSAMLGDPANLKRKILPLLHQSCELPRFLKPIQRIDVTTDELFEEYYPNICEKLGGTLRPNAPKGAAQPSTSIRLPRRASPPERDSNADYIHTQNLFGRSEELNTLNAWSDEGDPHPVLLIEAMGGSGKTHLAWSWLDNIANSLDDNSRDGYYWYSFYESGVDSVDFMTSTLSYMTGMPRGQIRQMDFVEQRELLVRSLKMKRWILVLDGFERLLVEYNRIGGPENDEEKGVVRHEGNAFANVGDEDLFRSMLALGLSKILITSRIIPGCFVNRTLQLLPGLKSIRLAGLKPEDAEMLIRSCGIDGDSMRMKRYFSQVCDCHPMVVSVIAGMINSPGEHTGDFNAWIAANNVDFGSMDLVQRRNHILGVAMRDVSESAFRLLATLTLLKISVDYKTLIRIVSPPKDESSNESNSSVSNDILELKNRALINYDSKSKVYDIHPVIQGVVRSRLEDRDKKQLGMPIHDFLNSSERPPTRTARSLKDIERPIAQVSVLVDMGMFEEAWIVYDKELCDVLRLILERPSVITEILKPFFQNPWKSFDVKISGNLSILNRVALAFSQIGSNEEALQANIEELRLSLISESLHLVPVTLLNISTVCLRIGELKLTHELCKLAATTSESLRNTETLFVSLLELMRIDVIRGRKSGADKNWNLINTMGRDWDIHRYRQGQAELEYIVYKNTFDMTVTDSDFDSVEKVFASEPESRHVKRKFLRLKGEWLLKQGKCSPSIKILEKAVSMAAWSGIRDRDSETLLVHAKHMNGIDREDTIREARYLSEQKERSDIRLANLWDALGCSERVCHHAGLALTAATKDAPEYVFVTERDQAEYLLSKYGCSSCAQGSRSEEGFEAEIGCLKQLIGQTSELTDKYSKDHKDEIDEYKRLSPEEKNKHSNEVYYIRSTPDDKMASWFFLKLERGKRKAFDIAMNGTDVFDLKDYGEILHSGYGDDAPSDLKMRMTREYNVQYDD